jgi:DEAD/DEAH box helicase domain-containing protein
MNFVYFDLETERAADEVGGWSNIEKLGVSVAVTCSARDDKARVLASEENQVTRAKETFTHRVFLLEDIEALLETLRSCEGVIGFNTRGFDFRVLQPFANFDVSALPNLDLMLDLKGVAGFRPSLESCCAATFGAKKSSDGLEALRWWREGRRQEVIDYCKDDVTLTRLLHEFGAKNGFVKCLTRSGAVKTLAVSWSLNYLIPPPQQGSLF